MIGGTGLLLVVGFGPMQGTGAGGAERTAGQRLVMLSGPRAKSTHISVAVSLSKSRIRPGATAKLKVRVKNMGDSPIRNIQVKLRSSNGGVNLRVRSFTFGWIGQMASVVRSVTVKVSRRARGRASLTARTSGQVDSIPMKVIYLGPCADRIISHRLLCPDLQVARPSDMYLDTYTKPGRTLLRSTNNIESRGKGPMELRGRRDRPRTMAVVQAIRRRSGGFALFPVQARLRFHNVGAEYGGSYWKVRNPLRFELWKLDAHGKASRRVRVGPKQFYCFRDLERTKPGSRSPESPVYPACNQNPRKSEVTLGTSVGWSDIYPSTYDQQWIDVSGLRGCFAYVLKVDPKGLLYESRESNNVSQRKLRLPFKSGSKRGC